MGALSSPTQWILEDDLLLKNAMEAGASLESLAKGAVSFSRRYTLKELYDRWSSILYDSNASLETSARILGFENESSTTNPSKTGRTCSSKGKDFLSHKRKVNSVRNHYYAMRKRICTEPCNTADLDFLVAPCSCAANGRQCICRGSLNSQKLHSVENIAIGVPVVNCYEQSGTTYNGGQNVFPDGIVDRDCLCRSHVNQSFEHDYIQKDPQICRENHIPLRNSFDVGETDGLQSLPSTNLYKDEIIEAKQFPICDSQIGKSEGFIVNRSEVPDSGDSFDLLGTIWKGSAPTMPMDIHITEEDPEGLTRNDTNSLQGKLNDGTADDGMNSTELISENDFIDFTGSYMEFSADDEFLFMDVDETPIVSSSPRNANQVDVANASDPKPADAIESTLVAPDLRSEGTNNSSDPIGSELDIHNATNADMEVPHTGETIEIFLICTLNTEDTEIPCNDDIILPTCESNSKHQSVSLPPSIKILSVEGKSTVGDLPIVKEENVGNTLPLTLPAKAEPSGLQHKVGLVLPSNGCTGAEFTGHPINSVNDPNSCTIHTTALKEECVAGDLGQHGNFNKSRDFFLEKPVPQVDHVNYYSANIADGPKQEIDDQIGPQKCVPANAAGDDLGLQGPIATVSTSDQEEQFSESDDDVPSYSDVEAMIIGMDLGPYDPESRPITKEVLQYQSMSNKKTLIRLEQGFHSSINRAIVRHGAFAILYGMHLKYYIKTPEVSLGRETEDVKVDIDLGREGHANKISRRQAIIKMDEDGSFFIKNIGKCSVFVDGKEVLTKKRKNLRSDSLIQIRDLKFIFAVNEKAVRRYLSNIRRSNLGQNTRFDWVPGQNQ
ncbi:uncharacterized protein LOC109715457 isoform X2 [Ananas comosus]|uniref:Uncharacterized protein LOC109715457 isoform X2 n=1 Tax=Ananas comosus TaxID=4615 RepID=A0A6P5FSJ5_ANACO|nr:uncharacterized protein LOC109715457 isoform X2 [Ananas comosus]